jgi:putative two-component system response regulator
MNDRELEVEKTGAIYALAKMVESKDFETDAHTERIGIYSRIITQGMDESYCIKEGFRKQALVENIKLGSILHDIGELAISRDILNKPGRLNPEEMDIVREHTRIGARMIHTVLDRYPKNEFMQLSYDIALHHHENWDGSGYPDGLAEDNIPLVARIVAIADAYDALVSRRSYREPYSHDEAMSIIMEGAGSHFDPYLVRIFRNQGSAIQTMYEKATSEIG